MKRKAVREIYATICEWSAAKTRPYERGFITFDEFLRRQADTMSAAWEAIYIERDAGRITPEEAQTIAKRFTEFVKREIKNACKA
jgi:hypothetical protein